MRIALSGSIVVFVALFYIIGIASAQISESIASGKNSTGNNPIDGHSLGNQSYNIRVVVDHIFISKKNGSIEISEVVIFRNDGPEIYYSEGDHTFFAISTPPGVRNLKTEVMECCLVELEGVVLMDPMQPIAPGDNFEMQISYTLPPRGSEFIFNKTTVYNTTSLSVFVDRKGGLDLEGPYSTLKLQGNEYNVIAFNDIKAGETVGIPIRIIEGSGYLYAGIIFIFLFSVGFVYLFKERIFIKREKEYTLEELELEKRRIFQAIRGFEKHAGAEKSEEYKRLMEEYRQKAIQIFIKMDKIKSKDQPANNR